jgi:hypothetical protein
MKRIIYVTELSIIAALLGLLYANIDSRIAACQTKEMSRETYRNIRMEIRLGNKNLETILKAELKHIKEAIKNLKDH